MQFSELNPIQNNFVIVGEINAITEKRISSAKSESKE
jgi:hypothetical protein